MKLRKSNEPPAPARRPAAKKAQPAQPATPVRPEVENGGARLGELLVSRRAVKKADLTEALLQQEASGKRLGTLLVELGAVDERIVTAALADQLGVPVADLGRLAADPAALSLIPEDVARTLHAIPIAANGQRVDIAVADPLDEGVRGELRRVSGREVALYIAAPSDIRHAIDRSYRALVGVERHVQAFEATESTRARAKVAAEPTVEEDAPVVEVVNLLITQALRDRASDVHVEPQEKKIRVRYRIDGALHDVLTVPGTMGPALVSRIKIMAGMNIVERRRSQDGQIETSVDGRPLDIRVATTATIWGEKAVLRLLDKSRGLYRLDELGMTPEMHDAFSRVAHSPFGMVICAGPTGSGKTTTLYATIAEINQPHRNIVTIEDPVEYVLPSINQIQINEAAGVTFAAGLKSILRQDPDVILVGEVRDVDTARIAFQSALTGHLVLSTLHATDSAAALHRFLDMGIEAFLVASSVLAVVAQRLVRRICTHCRAPYTPSPEELSFFTESGGKNKTRFWQGEGCNYCAGTGYEGRIGVYELMRITPEIKRLVVGWATQDDIARLAVSQGMSTLRQEGIRLVAQDVTTIAEVIRNIYTQ